MLDLDLFSRALRMRWIWYEWTSPDRPWVGTEPPVTAVDRQLFRASTVVTLGDGAKASFWQSSWMQGQAPMDIFPDLFKLAWRKNKSVKEEVHNQNWVRGLWRMQTVEEMANFVKLWDLVQEVQLNNKPDSITWKWTSDGNYTAKSAYNVQFLGSYSHFNGESIWKAESEGKHKFFAWLMVQCKLLTTDKLLARHWPCNPICSLCNQEHETTAHLILHCPFARLVWEKMEIWTRQLIRPPQDGLEIIAWWQTELAQLPKTRRLKAALMMYCAWNIWKERNRRVFELKQGTPAEVLHEIKMEIETRSLACGRPELP